MKNILLIDDDAELLKTLGAGLKHHGYAVIRLQRSER